MGRFFVWFGSRGPWTVCLVFVAAVVAAAVTGMAIKQCARSADAAIPVPHSRWLAQCSALPVTAGDGITVERVTARPGRVDALLRQGKRRGWLQAVRMGAYNGSQVYAVRGPTALLARMRDAPECSTVVPWGQVTGLPAAARAWIAERSTCCGSATLSGRTFNSWPCGWGLAASEMFRPALSVTRLDGYGPGVVGSRGACAEYATEP